MDKSKKKILFIEDEPFLRKMYADVLKKEGYKLDFAVNGEGGLDKILHKKYDLIFLDTVLPKMFGDEILKKFKKTRKKQGKIVMLTNIEDQKAISKAFKLGVVGYELTEKTNLGDLPGLIKGYLNNSISKEESKKKALRGLKRKFLYKSSI